MEGYTYKGKQKLCYTEVSDFTDFQGLGHDPLYKRYDSVMSVVKRVVTPEFQHFLAAPQYIEEEDQICWHINSWNETPRKYTSLEGAELAKYQGIKDATIQAYRNAIQECDGEELMTLAGAIHYIYDEHIYCSDNKVYVVAWGMTPDTRIHKVVGSVIHEYDFSSKFKIKFDAGNHGHFESSIDKSMLRPEGFILSQIDLPSVCADEGWIFEEWSPSPLGMVVDSDLSFVATYKEDVSKVEQPAPPIESEEPVEQKKDAPEKLYEPEQKEPEYYRCSFDAGKHGTIEGQDTFYKIENSTLTDSDIPKVNVKPGYTFKGWNVEPLNMLIDGDKNFVAQYEPLPWYQRFWTWLTGKGCLKWLLWLLIFLLILGLLSFFLRSCVGCDHILSNDEVGLIDSVKAPNGRIVKDNGTIQPVTGDDGKLPNSDGIVAPIIDEGGEDVPIVRRPGTPDVIGNRLFLFMEEEDGDIDALAQEFKRVYPDNEYSIIGFDKEVKSLTIQVPEDERDDIRESLNAKIPNQRFLVFDEEIYEINGHESGLSENPGWHLKAIHLQQGWNTTKGSSEIRVAIVDDGIEAGHPMFSGRIEDAYNVFTQNNKLSQGSGHGTHVAGLAVGCADYYDNGASGVAPNCTLIPIQVFDNKRCPLSALVSGAMYAIHHNADVVNLSVGPHFSDLNLFPKDEQEEIAKQYFKNLEKLWNRVSALAAEKNCILVFAAGNDNILSSIPPTNRSTASITVTAVDKNLYQTDFTNYGECSDISAPGKDIYSSFPKSSFSSFDGTSMAAPIVTGTIALMKSIKKDLTVEQAKNVLYKSGSDVYGNIPPMVLVDEALACVKRGDFSTPSKRTMPPVPNGKGGSDDYSRPIVEKEPQSKISDTDYDEIRKEIKEHKEKIKELEKLLPKN